MNACPDAADLGLAEWVPRIHANSGNHVLSRRGRESGISFRQIPNDLRDGNGIWRLPSSFVSQMVMVGSEYEIHSKSGLRTFRECALGRHICGLVSND